jgi:hypothetical protein
MDRAWAQTAWVLPTFLTNDDVAPLTAAQAVQKFKCAAHLFELKRISRD